MGPNQDKFENLQYGFQQHLKTDYDYLTPGADGPIVKKTSVKDLGLIIQADGNFNEQIAKVIKTVRQKMGWIRRVFISREPVFLRFMWRTYCLPLIDYGSILWLPLYTTEMRSIEALQRGFTASVPGLPADTTYTDRLKLFGLHSIERRGERFRCLYMWRVLEGTAPDCSILETNLPATGRMCVVNTGLKTASTQAKKLRSFCFQTVGAKLFNSLPLKLRDKQNVTLDTWKSLLDAHLATLPDKPLGCGAVPEATDPLTARPSNSILHWQQLYSKNNRRT
jgi:hypothetical protein